MPGGHVAVVLSGEIDIVTASAAREVLAEAVGQAVTGVTVVMGDVTFIDAAGLGVLAGAGRCARHLPGGLQLAAVPARVLRLLRLTGLDLPAVPAPPASRPQREHDAPLPAGTGSPAGTS